MFAWFHEEKQHKIKGMTYAICGILAGTIYINIGINQYYYGLGLGSDALNALNPLVYFLGMGGFYLGGLVFYVWRIPERFAPGKFVAFNSHAIFHTFIVLASLSNLMAVLLNYRERMETMCIHKN